MKLRYLFIISLLVLLAAGWAARTKLVGQLISPVLHSFGLTDVDSDVRQFELNHSKLSHIDFTLAADNSMLRIEAYDINISYNISQLIQGHIDSVTVGSLIVHHEGSQHSADNASLSSNIKPDTSLQPINMLAALRQVLREHIIFNTASIQHLTLHGETYKTFQNRPLRLSVVRNNSSLYAEISLLHLTSSGQHDILRQIVISRLDQDSLSADLRSSATTASVAARLEIFFHDSDADTFDKTAGNKIISGNYHLIPAQLQHWLQPFADLNGTGEIDKIDGTFSVSSTDAGHIAIMLTAESGYLKFNNYKVDNIFLKLKTRHNTADTLSQIKIENGSYIKAGKFLFDDSSLTATPLFLIGELTHKNGRWQYKAGTRSDSLAFNFPPHAVQLKAFTASLSGTAKNMAVSGSVSPAKLPGKFSFNLAHDRSTGHGEFTLQPLQAIDLNAESNKLSQLVSPWSYPFELLAGQIKLSSHATWSPDDALSLTAEIKLEDGGGTIADEIVFSGLTFDHTLELLPQFHSVTAGKIELSHLDSGVTANNITTSLILKTAKTGSLPRLVILGLHGDIFGGKFTADDFIYDLNKKTNHFKLNASDIDLAAIVETQQLENIEVTGRVDGSIPVEINEQGMFIEHGALVNAVRAGTIRYNPAAGTDQLRQNPLTGIALDALKDFRYSHLSADVNYTPEGTLSINLQLKGTSPELDTDRPVHLNINTEQNLIALLKSLRFAQGVSDNIDKKVRQQYEKSRSNN